MVRRGLAGSVVAGVILLSAPAVAGGAGTSYSTGPSGEGNGLGVPGSVVTTCDETGGASSCTANLGPKTLTVMVPAGDLPAGSQLVVTLVTGQKSVHGGLIVEFGIGAFDNGSKITGTFTTPLTATLSGPGKSATHIRIYVVTTGGGTPVTGVVTGNTIVWTVPSDPVYQLVDVDAIATLAATSSGSGTTLAQTGANIIPEVVAGSILVLFGTVLFVGARRLTRSRQASRVEP